MKKGGNRMKSELQKKLFDKYPKLFRQKNLSCKETCMCWGIETPDSWYNILDCLCWKIQTRIDHPPSHVKKTIFGKLFGWLFKLIGLRMQTYDICYKLVKEEIPQIEFTQVKEKFGTLRCYTRGYLDWAEECISMAEALTSTVCAICGSTKNVKSTSGWVAYLCEDCMKKENRIPYEEEENE
jgi:hypothetical protein